jgi:hypothetical protein
MHREHIGLWQTTQVAATSCPGCFPQNCEACGALAVGAEADAEGSLCEAIFTRLTGVGDGRDGRDAGDGAEGGWGEGGVGATTGAAGAAAAVSVAPYSSRIN